VRRPGCHATPTCRRRRHAGRPRRSRPIAFVVPRLDPGGPASEAVAHPPVLRPGGRWAGRDSGGPGIAVLPCSWRGFAGTAAASRRVEGNPGAWSGATRRGRQPGEPEGAGAPSETRTAPAEPGPGRAKAPAAPTQHAAARRAGPHARAAEKPPELVPLASAPQPPTVKDTAATRRPGGCPGPASCACGPRQGKPPTPPAAPLRGVVRTPPPEIRGRGGPDYPPQDTSPPSLRSKGSSCGGRLAAPKSDPPTTQNRRRWVPVRVRHHHEGPAPRPPGPAGSSRLPGRRKRVPGPCGFDCFAAARGRRSQPPWTPGGPLCPLCPLHSYSRPKTRATP
jgi:hypothetical protein